jgi:hypothetical protein
MEDSLGCQGGFIAKYGKLYQRLWKGWIGKTGFGKSKLILVDSPVTIVIDFHLKGWIILKIARCCISGSAVQDFHSAR